MMRRRASPPVITLIALGGIFGAAYLVGVAASTGSPDSNSVLASVPWLVWKVVAALALVIFVALFLLALQILRNGPEWGLLGPGRRTRAYVIVAGITVTVIAIVILLVGASPDIPVRGLAFRTRAVLFTGMLATIPWLALVWLAHAECHDLEHTLRNPADEGQSGSADAAAGAAGRHKLPGELIARLMLLWKLLVACVSAFAVAVIAAIVNSGALRATFLFAHPARSSEFPPANVLFYGAFFALILSVIAVPLVASWRACAFRVVERAYPLPPDGQPTEDWFSARTRLEKLLHLDVPLVRNPLTALSIFAPLITAALAAFIPQLATS
jgi:hypothetical protein